MVADVLSVLDVQARERGVHFDIRVPSSLPLMMGNRDLMVTLLKNLVSNAVKFSHEGGKVSVVARREGDHFLLDVVDHGIGISTEDQSNLFEKFYRSEAAREAGISGTGLGLVLAKEAVKAHDGTIEVQSTEGVGTRFTVTLPVNGLHE